METIVAITRMVKGKYNLGFATLSNLAVRIAPNMTKRQPHCLEGCVLPSDSAPAAWEKSIARRIPAWAATSLEDSS